MGPAVAAEEADGTAVLATRDACPQCGSGRRVVVATLAPVDQALHRARPLAWNTS